MTYQEAFATWSENIRPAVVAQYGADDGPALAESWNNYMDSLAKDGDMTATEYHYCPAYDDAIPDSDAQPDYLLDVMGVTFAATEQNARPDGPTDWPEGSKHYQVAIVRGSKSFQVCYSIGPAHTKGPDLADVIHSLLMDTSNIDQPFEDWAADLGYDSDSRKAEAIYRACMVEAAQLAGMFTKQELDDLREVFGDY